MSRVRSARGGFVITAELDPWSYIDTIPNLVDYWKGNSLVSKSGVFTLTNNGSVITVNSGPFSGQSWVLNGTNQYLSIATGSVGALNVGASGNSVSVFSTVFRTDATSGFIAGLWREGATGNPEAQRQYGQFIGLTAFDDGIHVNGHVSFDGGPSPGSLFNYDYSGNASSYQNTLWHSQVTTYDGAQAISYYDGRYETPKTYTGVGPPAGGTSTYSKNPYAYTNGLFAASTSPFTIGANPVNGVIANYHEGYIGVLGVTSGTMTAAQVFAFHRSMNKTLGLPAQTYTFASALTVGVDGAVSTKSFIGLKGAAGTNNSTSTSEANGFTLRKWNLGVYGGFLRLSSGAGTGPFMWYDDQNYGIPLVDLVSISALVNNTNNTDGLRVCVRIGSTWYASATKLTATNATATDTNWLSASVQTLAFNPAAANWRDLTVTPGSALTLGATTASPLSGTLNAIGLFSDAVPTGAGVRTGMLSINLT